MLSSLIATKLYIPPLRPGYVKRPRLVDGLESGYRSGRRLTLVSAPAGYGKTSLLSEWQVRLAENKVPMAWLALEESDNEPGRFLHYLLAAVRGVFPSMAQELVTLLDSPEPPAPLEVVAGLINDIAGLASPIVLVLDDYHLIHTPEIHAVIGFLVDRAPVNLHVVIASRHDPLLPLPRLRARSQMTEVRLKDLRFRAEEAAAFLRQGVGLELAEKNLAALQDRTEGWAAGLQLAAISLADGDEFSSDRFIESFTGDDRHVLDYLLEEVLNRQPADVQQFLQDTAMLEKFCAGLCDALLEETAEGAALLPTGAPAGDGLRPESRSIKILEYLDRANLFLIPLDNRREWFRYHHLFSEALRHRLQHNNPGRAARLHRRAAFWFDQAGIPGPAFEHALATGDMNLAADFAERWLDPLTFDGQVYLARQWLNALPELLVQARPELLFRKSRVHLLLDDPAATERTLDDLERCLDRIPDPFPRRAHLWCLDYTERAMMTASRGNLAAATDYNERAARWLPPDDLGLQALVIHNRGLIAQCSGDYHQAEIDHLEMFRLSYQFKSYLGVFGGLGSAMECALQAGKIYHAVQLAEDFLAEHGEEVKDLPVLSMLYGELANDAYVQNRLEEAEKYSQQTIDQIKLGGIVDSYGRWRTELARIKFALGKPGEGEQLLRDAEPRMLRATNEREKLRTLTIKARIRLQQGSHAEAAQWAERYQAQPDLAYRRDLEDNTLAWVWLTQGKALEALQLLESRASGLQEKAIQLPLIENLALQSMALQRLAHQTEALETAQRSLHLAEGENVQRVFIDLGYEMALVLIRLRAGLPANDHLQAFLGQILAAFPAQDRAALPVSEAPALSASGTAQDDWVEALSEREVEVLRWMARGLNNLQIADQMVVAESTVKKHINHIFGKLGAENRTQALIKARERGLL